MITKSLWQENNGEMLFEAIEMIKPGGSDKADVGAIKVQDEVRRTLYADAVDKRGDSELTFQTLCKQAPRPTPVF